MKMFKLLGYSLLYVVMSGQLTAADSASGEKKLIYSTIQPIAFIAQEIGGDKINSAALIPQDKNHHSYIPTPNDLRNMRQAKLFFAVGLPVEEQYLKPSFKNSSIKLVDVASGIKRLRLQGESCCEEHDHQHVESNGSPDEDQYQDVHVWMSPANNLIIARNICQALQTSDPANKEYYQIRLNDFAQRMTTLDQNLKKSLAQFKGRIFLVYHPAFGYFAEHYGLIQKAVETGGKGPTPKQLEKLISEARKDKAAMIFVQPQFNEKYAEVVAKAVNAKVVRLDPMQRNVFESYQNIAAQLIAGMNKSTTQ
jgi:zinc transport system substrate-binding protein